jgi:uncharacterized protein (DUF342 family)
MSELLGKIKQQIAANDAVNIQILENGYAAALFIPEDVPTFPSQKQVYLAIEKAGVIYGINDDVIDTFVHQEIRGKTVVFAKGKQAEKGNNAKLIWHENSRTEPISLDITRVIKTTDQDSDIFQRIKKDQQILTKIPVQDGGVGITVFGDSVSFYGIDISIPVGKNTYSSKDGLSLLAAEEGIATIRNGKISILDIHHVPGSVGIQNGNVEYEGSVFIEGDIISGYKVEALGDIYIGGSVEGADVYSRSGNVIIKKGVVGQGSARILAGGRVTAGFIQDATIGAKADVRVDRYIINSAVTAGRYIVVTKEDGLVRGGTLLANKKIEVANVGNSARINTELKVGYTPPQHISRSRYQFRESQRQNCLELADVQKRVAFLSLIKERLGKLTDDKERQLASWQLQENFLQDKHIVHNKRRAEIEKQGQLTEGGHKEAEIIRIHNKVYPGVSISIGESSYSVEKEESNAIFFRVGDRIAFGPK